MDIDAQKPWEYSVSNPIRSVTFSAVVSFPYFILKFLAPAIKFLWGVDCVTPYTLLILPRLFMTFLSFIADFCVYQIAKRCYIRPWQCTEVFAGSYIMLVYATRTFSNSVELILMAVLLWRVCISIIESTKIIRKESLIKDLYQSSEEIHDKVKFARMKSKLPAYNYKDSLIISVVITYGVFVRPTFIVYSFVPVSYWLQRGVVTGELSFTYFHLRCMSLLPGVVTTFLICLLTDSFYYGSLSYSELIMGNLTAASFTVTPYNFLLYNSNSKNLETHGAHPWYLHFLVNLPILHGVLALIGLWTASKYAMNFMMNRITEKPKVYSLATMLLFTFIFPVIVMSCFPHQEPRFLLPTLIPLVLLFSDHVSIYALPKFKFTRHFFFLFWQVWNIFCVVIFGFLHQGGVTRTMLRVQDYATSYSHKVDIHLFFSHMYTPPTFLLMRRLKTEGKTEDGRKFIYVRSVHSHDMGSSKSIDDLYFYMNKAFIQSKQKEKDCEIIMSIAASLSEEFLESKPENVTVKHIDRIKWHLSMEHAPDLSLQGVQLSEECDQMCHFRRRLNEFSIDVYRLDFTNYTMQQNFTQNYFADDPFEDDLEKEHVKPYQPKIKFNYNRIEL